MEKLTLNPGQQAVEEYLIDWLHRPDSTWITVGGYAGTGKTTLIAHLREHLMAIAHSPFKSVAFCCYTGKAASILYQKLKAADSLTDTDSCGTIHRLIYKALVDDTGRILAWERNPILTEDLIIVDEGSMVNQRIWNDLLSYGKPIIVFGDHGQLPPVEGSFSLMAEPRLLLDTIVRQAQDNPMIQLSQLVRHGEPIPFGGSKPVRKLSLSEPDTWDVFENEVTKPLSEWLCVCARNKTRLGLNKRIRELRGFESAEPTRGDRVICLKNNYAKLIFNGMLGTIKDISLKQPHWYEAIIDLEEEGVPYSGTISRYQFNQATTFRADRMPENVDISERELGDLFDFGYALTVHKAQGSEADRVLVFEERMAAYDEQMWRRWLYTAITRAKKELIVFA
jgi:exodeoxyribonuclease-5